jgi:hypothetical protein
MGWARAALRFPEQFARWTWIIISAITQLRLARALAEDHRLPWERRRRPGRLTPGRVRRDFARLAALTGTSASPSKPSKAGPGRPKAAAALQHRATTSSRRPPDKITRVKTQEQGVTRLLTLPSGW